MSEIEERLAGYKNKYLTKDYSEILKTARRIISDVQYFKEHMIRTKRTEFFSFDLKLAIPGMIHNFFFRKLDDDVISNAFNNEDSMVRLLEIYYLLVELITPVSNWEDERKDIDVKRLIYFSEIVEWFYGLKLEEYLVAFVGCSSMLDSIYEHIDKLRTDTKKKDT